MGLRVSGGTPEELEWFVIPYFRPVYFLMALFWSSSLTLWASDLFSFFFFAS